MNEMQIESLVELNSFGFFSLKEKPSPEELSKYYEKKYFQEKKTYKKEYSSEEIKYFKNKIEQKFYQITQSGTLLNERQYSLLDVGCGEGFTLNFFKELGWNITGLDYSDFGCKTHNPDCIPHLIKGDIYENIEALLEEEIKFDLIWLDNVLEHVLDPLMMLRQLKKLSSKNGILVIEVPNDFSIVQTYLSDKQMTLKEFWVAIPDHISYFNREGLINICRSANWSFEAMLTDFPIDWFLFNEHSNYKTNKETGKAAHHSRIAIENLMHATSIPKVNAMYEAMGELGIGRQLIGFFRSK